MITAFDVARDYLKWADDRRKNPLEIPGIPYGFRSLDEMTGGIRDNQLTILAAETGMGKSFLLGQMSVNVAAWFKANRPEKRVRIVHCEMTLLQVQDRLSCQIAGVPSKKVAQGKVTDEEWKRIKEANAYLCTLPIDYFNGIPNGLGEVENFLREDDACGWWALDHIQELEYGASNVGALEPKAIAEKAKKAGEWARSICSGMVLSQLTNDVAKREDKRPTKADVFGGKMLQAPASVIMLLYSETLYKQVAPERRNDPRPYHLIIDKNRGGELGDIKLSFNPARACFVDTGVKVKE